MHYRNRDVEDPRHDRDTGRYQRAMPVRPTLALLTASYCLHPMRSVFYLAAAFVAAACSQPARAPDTSTPAPAPAPARAAIRSPQDLIAAMRNRYAGKWYRNLTFIQKSTYLRPDGTSSRVETWYEAGAIPGKLRIDLGEPSKGNGVLYRGDSAYSIQGGQIVDRRKERNPLLVLGFDVYGQTPAETLEQLREERIDLTLLRTDTLYGRRVYVVGAGAADLTTNQFWVDADRLLFVRLIISDPQGRRTQDVRFEKYVQHGGGWVAEEVRVYADKRLVFMEEYSNVRVNVALDESLFIPERWATATHWYKP